MGTSIREHIESAGTGDFSKEGYAGRIKVSAEIIENIDKIAAANGNVEGDEDNALDLAGVFNEELSYSAEGELANFGSYFQNVIGELGTISRESQRMEQNTEILRQTVNENRLSVSAVSLDEEMANLIQFQYAFDAAARRMTAIDELLDRVINKM